MQIDYPYDFNGRGLTAATTAGDHLRDMIEQVLFTAPGERVNRPTLGSGLLQLTFAPLSDELASATQFLVQGALQQWLGELIVVEQVHVTRADSTLLVVVQFVVNRTGERRVEQFRHEGAST